MYGSFKNKTLRLCVALITLIGSTAAFANAQSSPKPYLQPINVQPERSRVAYPTPSPTPLIQKTGSSSPVNADVARADILNPADLAIPGHSGVLVETLDGKVVRESYSNFAFNPASNVKVATAFAVLKSFGPDYRFQTHVFTDGEIDKATGTLNGNLYISGRDPIFNYEHGVAIANALNKAGVRTVNGDLVVAYGFTLAMSPSTPASANLLFNTLNSSRRTPVATRAWQNHFALASPGQIAPFPFLSITGKMYVDLVPTNARLLFSHESAPLKEIVKVMMCYSNNALSENLGNMIGGSYAVARTVQREAGVPPEQFVLQTSSGLGINRVTPQAMMKLLRTFRKELEKNKLTFADVMPVAGVDPGTLERRFTSFNSRGSVVAKTGTLGNTDGGASTLAGEMQTRNGKMLFVIFNQRGNNVRFRAFQETFVTMIQNQNGGAMPLGYASPSLTMRMANTRITYPAAATAQRTE
jgi:serine-type D-Ala-D-Ala carboxypeptidase/endopeptidase (penicillin-binding protein 4)